MKPFFNGSKMRVRNSHLTRRSVLSGLIAGAVAGPAVATAPAHSRFPRARPDGAVGLASPQATRQARSDLAQVLRAAGVSGDTSLIALDAETGEVIEELSADRRVPPASTAKAVTALYAYHVLGADFRFTTRILSTAARIEAGALRGDLVLQGGGDPNFQTEDLARMADALVAAGLRRVEGAFIVDDSVLPRIDQIDPEQPVSAGYNPAVSGLNLNFNRVHFQWEVVGNRVALSMDGRSDREIPPVSVVSMEAARRDLPVYTHRVTRGREEWTVAASALSSPGSRWLPVRQPALYAGDVLRSLLRARGCVIPAPEIGTRSASTVLAEHRSPPLTDILRDMLRFSTNITAEGVGLMASARLGGMPRDLRASASRMNEWIASRYGVQGMGLVDHSGLEDASRVTARTMAQYLRAAGREGILPTLLRDHSLRQGDDRNGRVEVSVQAKTGTLNFVSGLSGYAQRPGARAMVFAVYSVDLRARQALRDDDSESPRGTRSWTRNARALQVSLLERWSALHS